MATILKTLQTKNLVVDASPAPHGPNTASGTFWPETWHPWPEFNYETLLSIYGDILATPWGAALPRSTASSFDTEVFAEDTLEDILRRFLSPTVNEALHLACATITQSTIHLGRGSRCQSSQVRPDWSLVSRDHKDEDGKYLNLLPGDTKLHKKWHAEMLTYNYEEWRKPVSQIMGYMVYHETRYGFILSDVELVVFRITREPIVPGFAAGRRQRTMGARRFGSTGTDVSLESLTLNETYSFLDDDPYGREYRDPEYAVIPWSAYGNCLTIKLALWCLSMMVFGDTSLSEEYPPLDSWRRVDGGFTHNTSGKGSKRLPRGAALWEPSDASQDLGPQQGEGSAGLYDDQADAHDAHDETQDVIYVGQSYAGDFADEGGDGMATPRAGSDGDGDGDEVQSLAPESGSSRGKKKVRVVELSKVGRGKYTFANSKGKLVETAKSEWEKVDGGYEFSGGKHVYFTKKLP
jgi:hypothetical protein